MQIKEKKGALILAIASFCAGLINILVGAGGGVLLIFAMQFFVSSIEDKSIYAITNTAIMLMSVVSLISYIKGGTLHVRELTPFLIPALTGGVIGALLLGRIKTQYLRLIFAALTLYSGVKMIL